MEKHCRWRLKPALKNYRVHETYIRIKGENKYLYRAGDKHGQTIDLLLTAKPDTKAAKHFFLKLLGVHNRPHPNVINVNQNPTYPVVVDLLKAEGTLHRRCRLRQCKYLNNVVADIACDRCSKYDPDLERAEGGEGCCCIDFRAEH